MHLHKSFTVDLGLAVEAVDMSSLPPTLHMIPMLEAATDTTVNMIGRILAMLSGTHNKCNNKNNKVWLIKFDVKAIIHEHGPTLCP